MPFGIKNKKLCFYSKNKALIDQEYVIPPNLGVLILLLG
jgi:hypothetical protein